jgi:hypothetical protein
MSSSQYNATAGKKAPIAFDKKHRRLTAGGIMVDQISEVLDASIDSTEWIKIPRQWIDVVLSPSQDNKARNEMESTSTCDSDSNRVNT